MNTTRLRELCDAFDKGALRGDEMRELVALAREAAKLAEEATMHVCYCASCALDEAANVNQFDYAGRFGY